MQRRMIEHGLWAASLLALSVVSAGLTYQLLETQFADLAAVEQEDRAAGAAAAAPTETGAIETGSIRERDRLVGALRAWAPRPRE